MSAHTVAKRVDDTTPAPAVSPNDRTGAETGSATQNRDGQQNRNRNRNRNRRSDRPPMTRQVRVSKALSTVLRHKAVELGLAVRPDGYISLSSVLATQQLKSIASLPPDPESGNLRGPVTVDEIRTVIRNSDKQRFSLRRVLADGTDVEDAEDSDGGSGASDTAGDKDTRSKPSALDPSRFLIRANQGHSIAAVETEALLRPIVRRVAGADITATTTTTTEAAAAPYPSIVVHGTTTAAWSKIVASGGLSRMKRRHVHFAQGLPAVGFEAVAAQVGASPTPSGSEQAPSQAPTSLPSVTETEDQTGVETAETVISGIRRTSTVLVFIDLDRAIGSGLRFWVSDNGVVLTEGNDDGFVPLDLFKVVLNRSGEVLYPLLPAGPVS